MASQQKSSGVKKKVINVHKSPPASSSSWSNNYEVDENLLPLAARDSEYVGLDIAFYNTNFSTTADDSAEEEIRILDGEESHITPIFALFPNLQQKCLQEKLEEESTENVTKMLIGHKANFANMKHSKKIPLVAKLPSVAEIPLTISEDLRVKPSSEIKKLIEPAASTITHISAASGISKRNPSDTSCKDEELAEESEMKVKQKKKTKKKPNMQYVHIIDSSYSNINQEKHTKSRTKHIENNVPNTNTPGQLGMRRSSEESFADNESS